MPTLTWSEGQPAAIAEIISYKPSTTGTITRGSGTVNAKTGRLETMAGAATMQGPGGETYSIDAMLLCEYGTGFQPGDRFQIANQSFEVIAIAPGMTDNETVYLRLRR